MRLNVILLLFLSVPSFFLIGPTQPPLGVEALPRDYHKTSFYQADMNIENLGWTVDLVAKLCLIVPSVLTER